MEPPKLSVAPMMGWTDHHFRQLCRMLTTRTMLYTEMCVLPICAMRAAPATASCLLAEAHAL